ncbi:hypothetical protein AURDEDRAFT_169627 [Auricularia subglabra TFB-10046 SS5]|nr:hypothetical protein AURDEDRAFT_169627 [Auricularia subglabra TFB-10046 SS5]
MHQDGVAEPTVVLPGARSNTFTLAFSASDSHVISGGADETVRRYDVSQLPEVHNFRAFDVQEGSIRAISTHPTHDELFLSASEDGTVVLYDSRAASGVAGTVSTNAEFSGCQYHPHLHDLFLTTDSRGRCFLRDARMAFKGSATGNAGDAPGGIVRQYVTTLSRRCDPHIANPEASSVVFDSTGEKFAVIFQSYYPTIYALSDEYPFAVCTGKNDLNGVPLMAGSRTYANCCTMKHGSFGGPGDAYFATGSDDFRGYVWRIPDPTECLASRREMGNTSWAEEDADASSVDLVTSTTKEHDVHATTPSVRTRTGQTLRRLATYKPRPQSQIRTAIAVPSPHTTTTSPPRAAANAAPAPPPMPTQGAAAFLPALASLESALRLPPSVVAAPSMIAPISSLLAAPLSAITPLLADSTSLLIGHSSSAFSTTSAAQPSTTTAAHMATTGAAAHSSIMAVLVVGGVVATLFGGLAAWHSFRKSRASRRLRASPIFGGLTPPNFRPSEEKFVGRPWQTFEEKEGLSASTSAANDLAHLQYMPSGTALPPAKSTLAPAGLLTPSGFSILGLSPAKLRVRNADISKPRVGLGYETHSIHVPTKPAPKPPTPPMPAPPPNIPLPQLPKQPAPVFVMVTSASQEDLSVKATAAGQGGSARAPPKSGVARQKSTKATAMTPNERPLTELQTKVLTSALGLTSPPSPAIDLDLYRYTRYGMEEAHSEYAPSPPLPPKLLPPDASPNTALGQLLLDFGPSPNPYGEPPPPPPKMPGKSSSERSLELPQSYTHSNSSPGLPYLSSAEDGHWSVSEESRLAPLPTKPLKVARKDTRGPSKKHRVKRASLLPRLDFPMPPATVPARPSLWDEAAAM